MPAKPTARLTIERMGYGADAIAHDADGKTVFVSGGVTGDVVTACIVSDGASFSRARVDEVLEPSKLRVASACPFSSVCGGCPWASLSYPAQLEAKRSNVIDALTRIGHMDPARVDELVSACVEPGEPWGYRNKVELAFNREGKRSTLGMHTAGAQGIVRVDRCRLLDPAHSSLTKSVSGALTYLSNANSLDFERIGLRVSARTRDVEVALWTETGSFPRSQAARVLGDATKATSIVRVMTKGPSKARKVAGVECLSGTGSWTERVGDETMRLSAPSFFQVNTKGAEILIELVMDALDPQEDELAVDLYCGAGTFTLPLARRCDFVAAVEAYGPAVRDLRRNLEINKLDNVDVIGGDAVREFPDQDADVLVVDPPRAGLAPEAIDLIASTSARDVAYVSCDPATLARDLKRFVEEGTFSPVKITPVDLFPQTFHCETVVHLKRN